MVDVVGLVVVLVFYVVVLVAGILATRWYTKNRLDPGTSHQEASLVAGRKLGGIIGIFTMTATTVGGGYINGTAESMVTSGLAWTLAPFGICAGLIIGGLVFAGRMRDRQYLTMFDPFQEKYGHGMVALLYLAAMCGDIFWAASVLAALGTSLSVIIDINKAVAVVVSAAVTVVYTMFGAVISVAYTDVIQLVLITTGLVLCLPFAMTHPAVEPLATTKDIWLGDISRESAATWADLLIVMTFGTIPWQTYFQRVLSVKSSGHARLLSVAGGIGAFLLAVPPALIGVTGVSTDWNQTSYPAGDTTIFNKDAALVLPLVLRYLTPRAVSLIGLSAVAAAVMSSIDSAILASSSVFTHNIYKMALRKKASDLELRWIQRITVVIVAALATVMAIFVPSIYGLFILAADLVCVVMFPQLTAVVFVQVSDTYGAFIGYVVGVFLRLAAGEPFLSLPALIKYPYFDGEQRFPFRSFAMICSFVAIVAISSLTSFLFRGRKLPQKYDIFKCYQDAIVVSDSSGSSTNQLLDNVCPPGSYRLVTQSPDFMVNHATQNGYCEEQHSKQEKTNCGTDATS